MKKLTVLLIFSLIALIGFSQPYIIGDASGNVTVGGNLIVTGNFSSSNPSFKSQTMTTQGVGSGIFFTHGFYNAPTADANLNQGSATITIGSANGAEGAHAFIVSSGNGTTDGGDLVLTVTGTSFTDGGVRTTSDTEIIEATATDSPTDFYAETTKKWIGIITYTLSSSGGSTFDYTFNYGLAKYDDFGNRDFVITDFECIGLAGANDSGFNIELLHHPDDGSGWTYSAASFIPGNSSIASLADDYSTESNLVNNQQFSYKRTGLSTSVIGSGNGGFVIRITTTANNAVEFLNVSPGVTF